MRIPVKFTPLLLLLICTTLKAQQFGGNPPSIKWDQVNTPAAKVIFPVGMDSAATRVSNIVTQMNKAIQPTIGARQLQVSLLLQTQTTIANAYVGLAPFRSEFYLTPDQNSFDLGSLRWTDQLAVHEFRHVQQFNNFNVGLSKTLHVLFGEAGQAAGNELTIPNWFFEGDAVFNETYVTTQGRGRLPYYFNGYRALWAAGKDYSWMKLRNGSYRDFVPDWYPTGYMLVAYGRDTYGDDFWKDVTHNAASFKGLFYPLQKAVKQYSGKDFTQFRTEALDHFKKEFGYSTDHDEAPSAVTSQPADHSIPQSFNHSILKKSQHFIADEEYPAYADDNGIIYTKTTYDHVPVFVTRTVDQEREIRVRDYSLDSYFAYRDGKIVYASYRPDLRWGYRDYSELNIIDVNSGRQQRITSGTKYFSPAFSQDGKSIVAVQVSLQGKSELHILSTNGKLISAIPNKDNLFYTYPKFYGSQIISAVRRPDGKMALASIEIATGNVVYLLPFTIQPIAFPAVQKDMVYFSATSGKTDGLFALSLTSKKLYRLQNDSLMAGIGNYQPAIAPSGKIAWVSFTAYGYQVRQADNTQVRLQPLAGDNIPGGLSNMGISALGKGDAADLLATVNNTHPAVTKYHKAFHLLNFHSLIPTISDPNYSIALEGENVLNTLQSELLYNYNSNEGYNEFGFNTIYGALFPYLSAGVNYIVNRSGFYQEINTKAGTSQIKQDYYNETLIHGGIEVPLNLTKGHTSTQLAFGTDVVYDQISYQSPFNTYFAGSNFTYLNNYLIFSSHGRQAKKNIYPRYGESLSLNYKTAVTSISGNQFLASGNLFLPGLGINHNLIISGAYQQRDLNNAAGFSNDFPFSRGYSTENLYNIYKIGANYHFPIAYPDAGVANTVYVLRIRGNLFYDYCYASDSRVLPTYSGYVNANFRSTGAEVYFDTQLWNQLPVSIGIRYSHLLDRDVFGGYGPNRIELVLPLSFY